MAKIKSLMGATQWDSKALFIHSRIGELELLSAFTPIHTKENTLCYLTEIKNLDDVLSSKNTITEGSTPKNNFIAN